MGKGKRYRTSILEKKAKEEKKETARQEWLKEKYHKEGNDVVIVEKRMVLVSLARLAGQLLRVIAWLCLVWLALAGLIALIQPESREILYQVIRAAFTEIGDFTGLWTGP